VGAELSRNTQFSFLTCFNYHIIVDPHFEMKIRTHFARIPVPSDRRGVAAVEFALIAAVMVGLLLPISDLVVAAIQYMGAYQAERDLGAYAQYHTGAINTAVTPWTVTLPTIAGYTITTSVMCGTTSTVCSDGTLSPKWFLFSTTITLTPTFLTALAGSYTIDYSERFQ
jgi:Flp pilus assembly protein TadG